MAASTIKFPTNIAVKLTLSAGKYFSNSHIEYGVSHCWYGKKDLEDVKFYATPALHAMIKDTGICRGGEIKITKVELEGAKKGWEVEMLNKGTQPIVEGNAAFNGGQDDEPDDVPDEKVEDNHQGQEAPRQEEAQESSVNGQSNVSDVAVGALIEAYVDALRMWDHPAMKRLLLRLDLTQPSLEDIRTDAAKILITKQNMGLRGPSSPLYSFPVHPAWVKAKGTVKGYAQELVEWESMLEEEEEEEDPLDQLHADEEVHAQN
jgi:hypothetical protein